MAYPQRLLTPGEEIVLDLHPHWTTLLWPAALAPVVVGLASYLVAVMPHGSYQALGREVVLAIAALVLLVVSVRRWLRWESTRYVVTTRRVLLRSGLLGRSGRAIPLTRISDVTFSQTLRERLVRAGTLVVESPGEHGQAAIRDVPRVVTVQRTLAALVEQADPARWP